jgi:hypothetical protein
LPTVFSLRRAKDGDCVDNRPLSGTVKSSDTLDWEAACAGEPMTTQANRLPSHFPVGTKFVIESRPARSGKAAIYSRHVELPDGRSIALPSRKVSKLRQRLRNRGK